MLGNDVVDLCDPDSDAATLSARFDARVFTEGERRAIAAHPDPAAHRWRHWAAKEAAYKALRRQRPSLPFSPIRFEVDLPGGEPWQGRACYRPETGAGGSGSPAFRLSLLGDDGGALHVIAISEANSDAPVVHDFCRVSDVDVSGDAEAPSRTVRRLACRQLAERLGVEVRDLEVRKRGRLPELWLRGKPAHALLSLSHHGDWIGFACALVAVNPDSGSTA